MMTFLGDLIEMIPYQFRGAVVVVVSVLLVSILFQVLVKRWLLKVTFLIREIKVPVALLYGPVRLLFPALALLAMIPFFSLSDQSRSVVNHLLTICILIGVAWLCISLFAMLKSMVLSRYDIDVKDNLRARQISTQLSVIQRVVVAIIVVLTASAILMTFDKVRQIGVSMLASAGIAGIIIGFAAQRSLSTLIAGIQIAITQPVRIDDVVIVENEWGWIEEITLTYVVMRIWDQRRLIIPITYFIERVFQNWTKTSAELLGTVYIYTDYGTPVKELQNELVKIVQATPLWDGRVAKMQVTNATEKNIEIRALISAENSSNAWDLRCLVRERLIDFMQQNHPDQLPRIRVETNAGDNVERFPLTA